MRLPLLGPTGPAARRYAASPPDTGIAWRAADYCVLDVETTGLDPRRDQIIACGAVPVSQGRIRAADAFYQLIRPDCAIAESATRVHALRQADLDGAPRMEECLEELLTVMTGRILVAHSAWVERAFLGRALRPARVTLHEPVLDTAALAYRCLDLPRRPGWAISLEYTASALGMPVHTPHHALGDAMTTAEVFLALAGRLSAGTARTVSDLVDLQTR
ncbi:3'-5' exonuclease [Streptomyces sp. NPDC048277]|uniref:3'-5' exonuclease n=1 Tax=Streptomyces sp. NPDC048277 TaxID=3155027 RepID=UPI0033BFD882